MAGNTTRRHLTGRLLLSAAIIAVSISLLSLVALLVDSFADGLTYLDWDFLTSYPSRFPSQAGILPALFGTVWVVGLTALFAFPLGVFAAIYLEEYAPKNRITELIQLNIANLAGVPSIVYGLLGLGLFVEALALGRVVLAGALTMTLLILPVIIITSREAIRSVPKEYREGAFALGASKWQVTSRVVLPEALPGILTGTILSLSRAIGEAAPMIAIAALAYVRFVPTSPLDRFTVMPIQIYNWINMPRTEFRELAATGIIVLLVVLLAMNSIAILIRNKYQKRGVG
ncbi:TPA: phosphate ABC transporter permease PstA [Candidatus Bathyarchaeota archaeon]|jgi:phosphate transport system permease protein|nr:phosphate ABC transporter permease PstA [Candidatus Bathyarchaeota archaeon]